MADPIIYVMDNAENLKGFFSNKVKKAPGFKANKFNEKLNDATLTIEFETPAASDAAQALQVEGYVVLRDYYGKLRQFKIKEVEDVYEGGKEIRYCYAENAALELYAKIVRPQTLTAYSAEQAIELFTDGTRWQPGIMEWSGVRTIIFGEHKTALGAILFAKDIFGAEIDFRVEMEGGKITGRYIDFLERRGEYNGAALEYEKDITGFKRRESSTELYTALVGVGKAGADKQPVKFTNIEWKKENGDPVNKPYGLDYVGDPEALSKYGINGEIHLEGLYISDTEGTITPEQLLQETYEALQEVKEPRETFDISGLVLERLTGYEHKRRELGDTIPVIVKKFNPPLFLQARIIEIERDYSDPTGKNDNFVLGDYKRVFTNNQPNIQRIESILLENAENWSSSTRYVRSDSPPADQSVIWIDTSKNDAPFEIMKIWDGSAWVKQGATAAAEVGAETPTGAQGKADFAEETAKFYAKATSGVNMIKDFYNMALPAPYEFKITTLPDGSQGRALYKKHTAGATVSNARLNFPWYNVNPKKSYLLEFWVKAMDANSRYYHGREETTADGTANDAGNGPYGVNSRTPLPTDIGAWRKHYFLIPPHDAGAENTHDTQQSNLTPDTDYKFYNANTAKIQIKHYLTYGAAADKDSEMYATAFGLYEVGSDDALLNDITTAQETANTANETAGAAQTAAGTAQETAAAAQTAAGTAQETATTAKGTADTAKQTADTAKQTADSAATTAGTAKQTADTAKQTADTANQTAGNAWGKFSGAGNTLPAGNVEFNFAGSTSKGGNATNTDKVGTQTAATVQAATVNFNARNDRKATTPAQATIPTDGSAIDHTLNKDGSANISFEWVFSGSGDAYDIDGFIIYVRQQTASTAYTLGQMPNDEQIFYITPEKRAFIMYGVPAEMYYTFYVQAYRIVDQDINTSGVLKSTAVKSTASGENPYRPSATVAFSGEITGTINGKTPAEVTAQEQNAKNAVQNGQVALPTNMLSGNINPDQNALISATSKITWSSSGIEVSDVNNKKAASMSKYGFNARNGLFTIEDDISATKYSIVPLTNYIYDHSFEMLKTENGATVAEGGDFAADKSNPESFYRWKVGGGSPRLVTNLYSDKRRVAIFGHTAAVVNSANFFEQAVTVTAGETLTLSCHFQTASRSPLGGIPKMIAEARGLNDSLIVGGRFEQTFTQTTSAIARHAITFTVPAGTEYMRIVILAGDTNYVKADGVQMVNSLLPTIYEPENSLWTLRRGADKSDLFDQVLAQDVRFNGAMRLGSEPTTAYAETGVTGAGAFDHNTTQPIAGVMTNFRTKKTYVPSSITLTSSSSNTSNFAAIDISVNGFWFYVWGGNSTVYKYWRGTYTA